MRDNKTFNAFVEWLKTKPADETYDYVSATNCAFSQFLRETGRAEQPSCSYKGWRDTKYDKPYGEFVRTPMDDRLENFTDESAPLHAGTFGGILERLMDKGHL